MSFNISQKQRVRLGLFLLGSILFALSIGYFFTTWRGDWQLAHHQLAPLSAKTSVVDDTPSTIDTIPQAHLFGEALTGVGNMPLTNLQLHLTGIVHGHSGSKAYIAIASQPGKIYSTGDELPYGAKIFAITDDTVILQNDGRLEKITLPRKKLEFKAKNTSELS